MAALSSWNYEYLVFLAIRFFCNVTRPNILKVWSIGETLENQNEAILIVLSSYNYLNLYMLLLTKGIILVKLYWTGWTV